MRKLNVEAGLLLHVNNARHSALTNDGTEVDQTLREFGIDDLPGHSAFQIKIDRREQRRLAYSS
jgi:hypothetical protein